MEPTSAAAEPQSQEGTGQHWPPMPAGTAGLLPLPPEDWPNIDDVVIEDDTPVDSIFAAKQQRMLVECLYASWPALGQNRPFLADANVGLFYRVGHPPLVPDAFVSLNVQVPEDWQRQKAARSYFVWFYGKPPDVVIEIVSNTTGGEADEKLPIYATIGIAHYVIYDPDKHLSNETLRVFGLRDGQYVPISPQWLSAVSLGVMLWKGTYEGFDSTWLRWCDEAGRPLQTGAERADAERQRADAQQQRADAQQQRAERLAEQLKSLGADPTT